MAGRSERLRWSPSETLSVALLFGHYAPPVAGALAGAMILDAGALSPLVSMAVAPATRVEAIKLGVLAIMKRVAVGVALVFFAATVALLYAARTGMLVELARERIIEVLRTNCRVVLKFDALEVGLFPPELHLSEVEIDQLDGEKLIGVKEAIANLAVFPLLYGRLQLDRVSMLEPEATIEYADQRITNLPTCLEPKAGASPTATPVLSAMGVSDLRVERGRFRFAIPGQLDLTLDEIDIGLQPGASGGSDLLVGFNDAKLVYENKELPVAKFRLGGHLEGPLTSPRAINVTRLDVALEPLTLSGSGSVNLIGPVADAQLRAKVDLAALRKLGEESWPSMEGLVTLDARVQGTLTDPHASGALVVEHGRIEQFGTSDRAEVRFNADRHRVDVTQLEARFATGRVKGRGRVELDDHLDIKGDVELEKLSLARVMDNFGLHGAWADFAADAKVSVVGTGRDPFRLAGKVNLVGNDLKVYDRGWDAPKQTRNGELVDVRRVMLSLPGGTTVSGRWAADSKGFAMKESRLARGDSRVSAEARLNVAAADGMHIKADFENLDFADLGPIGGLEIGGIGKLAGEVEVNGAKPGPRATGSFDVNNITLAGIPFGHAHGSALWGGKPELAFTGIDGRLGRSSYEGSVKLNLAAEPSFELAGSIPKGRVEDFFTPFLARADDWGHAKGDLHGTFRLEGPIKKLSGPVELWMNGGEIVGEAFEEGHLAGGFDHGTLVAEQAELKKHGAKLALHGRFDPNALTASAEVTTAGLTLQKLDSMKAGSPDVDGDLKLKLGFAGPLHALNGTVSAELDSIHAGSMSLGNGLFSGRIAAGAIEVKGAMAGRAIEVEGKIAIKNHLPYQGTIRLNELDVFGLVGALQNRLSWTGLVTARADLSGGLLEWRDSSGKIALEKGNFDAPGITLTSAAPAKIGLSQGGVLDISKLVLAGPNTRLTTSGKVGPSQLDLAVDGRIDLAIVQSIFRPVQRSSGVLSLKATIGGSPDALDLFGSGQVENFNLRWRAFQSEFTQVQARLSFSYSTVLIERMSGRVDNGSIEGSGQVVLEGLKPASVVFDATLAGARPHFSYPKYDMSATVNGKLHLEGRPEHLQLRGDLDLDRAKVQLVRFDVMKLVGGGDRSVTPEVYDPSSESLFFDLNLHLKDGLRLTGDLMSVELTGDLEMTGSNQRLGLLGKLNAQPRGRVNFIRDYTLLSGTIDFDDRFRFAPRFDLVVTPASRVCDADITVSVNATLDSKPQIFFQSKPEMDDSERVGCLYNGIRTKSQIGAIDTGGRDQATGLGLAGLWNVTGLGKQVKKVLPVDQIDLTSEYSSKGRQYENRVLVAKEVLEGKLRLEYSSSLVRSDDQRASVRYRISPELTLHLTWTSSQDIPVGDLGLAYKYRWEW